MTAPTERGHRSNGLAARGWAAIADLDPRIADDMLITLYANGIAGYVEPTPTGAGSGLEPRPVRRLTDRLFADEAARDRARAIVASELAELQEAAVTAPDVEGIGAEEDDHFHPPPPPPLPRLRPSTLAGLALIGLGLVILVTGFDGGDLGVLGVIAIVAGVASLVWHMKDGPPTDSGWDDGAVL